MPIVAEERDIETPRCLEIDGLADADAVALAFDGSGRDPQATVVGIADDGVGQPARQPPPSAVNSPSSPCRPRRAV